MKNFVAVFLILALIASLVSCASTKKTAILGATVGTVVGAGIGAAVGGKKGAAIGAGIGAAVGGLAGFAIGKSREKQVKTAEQIYREKPGLVQESTKNNPPEVAYFNPCILDTETDQALNSIKNGEWVWLASEYEINIPQHSEQQEIEVTEYNTLVSAEGLKMEQPELTRTKMRKCERIIGGIEVEIPKDLPSGNYTHVATLKVVDNEYKQEQQVYIAKTSDGVKVYALNDRK